MADRFDFKGTKAKSPYFEGWYVKASDPKKEFTLALIPGVALFDAEECFVQYNLVYKGKTLSGKITFPIEEFTVVKDPYSILMPSFVLSKNSVKAHLKDDKIDLMLDLSFGEFLPLDKSLYSPSIMGPFEYLKMPCAHDVISMRHKVSGTIVLNGESITIASGMGYLEKDRGSTFPNKYVWGQSNIFKEKEQCSVFLSVAEIDLSIINFMGTIAVFHDGEKEHRFATYLGANAEVKVAADQQSYVVKIKDAKKSLTAEVSLKNGDKLIAPMKNNMDYAIKETVKATISLVFEQKNKEPLHLNSEDGAAECVNWNKDA
ncbi:tocopherol cyclase family protein [Alkalibacterium kapii]|uniref:Tocopherol cyclase n=1 Tax=Alkalibacterium kapii TaxID=426704 RepID=A0A511AT21_9LACT|nr:tocopherol cyclase family protein [Alkalibacterium kapii]GEK90872.1 hypothetical protein AKA01nite_04940 [Alkalibacterium kapii]